MDSTYPIPSLDTLANTMGDLLGVEVSVDKGEAVEIKPDAPVIISISRDDVEKPAAAMICDLALAAFTGASLAMMPPDEAKAAKRAKKLPDSLFENFSEVVNIVGGTLFNSDSTPHTALREVLVSPSKISSKLRPLLTEPADWLFADVDIEGYGGGKMVLLASAVEVPEEEAASA